MTDGNAQIVAAYEVCGLTPEEIASEYGYDPTAVKMILAQCSRMFINSFGGSKGAVEKAEEDGDALFSKDDMKQAADVFRTLARESESDIVRLKAAQFIIDEKKGRNDARVISNAPKVNIVMLNEQIRRARVLAQGDLERVKQLKAVSVMETVAA